MSRGAAAGLRTLAVVAAAGAAAALLWSSRAEPDPDGTPARPATGAYLGAGPRGVAGLDAWERWTGSPADYGMDFLPDDSWRTVAGPDWLLNAWDRAGRALVLSVPMLARPPAAGPPPTLERCAAGDYDADWRALAGRLVAHHLAGTIVRPGWEFNGPWYAWAARGREGDYAGCFRRLVSAMRAVPGQRFRFVWNPALGAQSFPADRAYPGDSYVDMVGVDVYDASWRAGTYPEPAGATGSQRRQRAEAAWRDLDLGDHGLRFWVDFAARHALRLCLPEWGLSARADGHGGGDNPVFVWHVLTFLADPRNRVAFALYFNADSRDGDHHQVTGAATGSPDTAFPTAARLLRAGLADPGQVTVTPPRP
jgi:hypothetical protein